MIHQLHTFPFRLPFPSYSTISSHTTRTSARVLVQPEMEKRRSPLVSIPPFGRGFSRHGVFRSDGGWGRKNELLRPVHRLDEPAGISLGMVASPQSPLPFRPAKSL